ncbi:unnamed protein product [Caenorhabditis angaria]|uniref:SH3 domain-containing protein n=1 Tax=Caenorhabditis angaria TaxID=860376 RepID=A0A9P1I5E2_9PELO|nr:unnamed protein product [Caenorhabditis angaria]
MTQVAEAEVMSGNVKDIVNRLSRDMTNRVPFSVHSQNDRRERQIFIGAFPYTSQQEDELSFGVGDVIELIEEVEDGWSRGRLKTTGAIGMFPTNFVHQKSSSTNPTTTSSNLRPKSEATVVLRETVEPKAIERTPSTVITEILKPIGFVKTNNSDVKIEANSMKEMARVKFVYIPQHPDELALSDLDVLINIVNKNCGDAGWFEGELHGKNGLFPDNFVELVQVPAGTESGAKFAAIKHTTPNHIHHKPPPQNPPQPAVPPKPLKMKMESAAGSNASASTPTPISPISPTTSTGALPPFQSATVASKKDAFAALRDKITSNLKVVGPPPLHSGAKPGATNFESTESDVGGAGAEPTMNPESGGGDQITELQHITKNRARPQKNRPMSMVMNRQRSSDESPSGARLSSPTTTPLPMSTSMFAPSTLTSIATSSSATTASPGPKPILPPSSASKPALRPILPQVAASHEDREKGDFVSRAEYNELLERLKLLENRLAAVESSKKF